MFTGTILACLYLDVVFVKTIENWLKNENLEFVIGSDGQVNRSLKKEDYYKKVCFVFSGMTSLMSSPFSAMSPFCTAQSYVPLTASAK